MDHVRTILNFDAPLDVSAFDTAMQIMAMGSPAEIHEAQAILTEFKNHPSAFTRVEPLLHPSVQHDTRFFALGVLEEAITTRWNTFAQEERDAIRTYLIDLLVRQCTSVAQIRNGRALLNRMNKALVGIAKRDWPVRWPTFVRDVVTSARVTEPMVENNLRIFIMLAEEVFDACGARTMTSRWIARKRDALRDDFGAIYELCVAVLLESQDVGLVNTALQTLTKYVKWVPPNFMFQDAFFQYLCDTGLGTYVLRTSALACLTEIFSIGLSGGADGDHEKELLSRAFTHVVGVVAESLPPQHSSVRFRMFDYCQRCLSSSEDDERFVDTLCIFLTTAMQRHMRVLHHNDHAVRLAHELLLGITMVDDKEMFRTCVDYWWFLGDTLVRNAAHNTLKEKLKPVLSETRYVLIERMAKPEEVIIVEDENHELHKQVLADVESQQLYQQMREALVFLTNLDPRDTHRIMTARMARQRDRSEWSWHNLNTLCWAVGAISGAMSVEAEKDLFVEIVKELLTLCADMSGKENRAVIASNIMYVVGQYPRFLRNHASFLRTVVKKLFEFMKETFPGVQDMAVDTFLKIAKLVPDCFIESGFVYEILRDLMNNISMLNYTQVQTFFSAIGCMIGSVRRDAAVAQELLRILMNDSNATFKADVSEAATNFGAALTMDAMREVANLLRLNASVAATCGPHFVFQMHAIFWDLQGFYGSYSNAVSVEIATHGEAVAQHQHVRLMRAIKKEILRIIELFVQNTNDEAFVTEQCMPSILSSVLLDYTAAIPAARDASVLALLTACVNRLQGLLAPECANILDAVFPATVPLISSNMEDYPDHRIQLFKLLHAFNTHCFPAFLEYVVGHADVINGILWAVQHTERTMMLTGLETLSTFINNVAQSQYANSFVNTYLVRILSEVLVSALDTLHAPGIALHGAILARLFSMSRSVPPGTPGIGRDAVLQAIGTQLLNTGSVSEAQITTFLDNCYSMCETELTFRTNLEDFLVEMQVWGAEQENQAHAEEERRNREQTVPGFLNPTAAHAPTYQSMEEHLATMLM